MPNRHPCILALDPSLIETGYAIIDGENQHVQHYGTIPHQTAPHNAAPGSVLI